MTPPKVRFLRPNKVSGGQKSFWGAPKIKKNDFLKKPEFCDLSEHPAENSFSIQCIWNNISTILSNAIQTADDLKEN